MAPTKNIAAPTNRILCDRARALLRVVLTDYQQPRARTALLELQKWVRTIENDQVYRTSNGVTSGLLDACRACLDTVSERHPDVVITERIGSAKDGLAMAVRQFDNALRNQGGRRRVDGSFPPG